MKYLVICSKMKYLCIKKSFTKRKYIKMEYSKRKKDIKNAERIVSVFEKERLTAETRWKAVEATAKKCRYTVNGVYKVIKREGLWEKA